MQEFSTLIFHRIENFKIRDETKNHMLKSMSVWFFERQFNLKEFFKAIGSALDRQVYP